jgi:hypothetical protein
MLERSSRVKGRFVTKKPPLRGGKISPKTLLAFAFPAGFGCSFGDTAPLLRAERCGPRITALKPPSPSKSDSGGILTAFAGRTSGFTHNAGGKLVSVELRAT